MTIRSWWRTGRLVVGSWVAVGAVEAAAQDPPIFREISIAPYGVIALGRPFDQARSPGRESGTQLRSSGGSVRMFWSESG